MKYQVCQNYILSLFETEKLAYSQEEYGFTYEEKEEISKIGYATNLTPEIIEEARSQRVDFIITHHDAWSFVFGMKDVCLEKLKSYRINHFFVHAPLDVADFGTNVSLMQKIGARIIAKTNLYQKLFYVGRVGEFDEPMEFEDLVRKTEYILKEPVLAWKNNNRLIKRIGIVTGGGSMTNDVKEMVKQDCDVYITGEKALYTVQYARFAGVNLIVGSHTFTEVFGLESLAIKLKEQFSELEILKLHEPHFESGDFKW